MCFVVFQYFDNRAEAHNFLKILGARQLKFLGIKANNQPFLTSESSTHAPANCSSSTDACHRRHEREKRRAYEQRVLEVEHGAFTPLVLSTSGGWGPSATVAFKRLAGLISEKYDQPYSSTLSFIRCKIVFSLIDSAIACLRAPRSALSCSSQELKLDGLLLGPHPR